MADPISPIYELHVTHNEHELSIALNQYDKPIYIIQLIDTSNYGKMIETIEPLSSHSRIDIPIQSLKNVVLSSKDESRTKIHLPGLMNLIVSEDKIEIDKEKIQYYRSFKLSVEAKNIEFGNFEADELEIRNRDKSFLTTKVLNALNVNRLTVSSDALSTKSLITRTRGPAEFKGILTNKGKICTHELIINDCLAFMNDGELDVDSSYFQKEGIVLNVGTWKQEGHLQTYKTEIVNTKNLQWKDMNWTFESFGSTPDILGSGEIYFDHIVSSSIIHIHGFNKITLKDSQLKFSCLVSPDVGIVHCLSGQYHANDLQLQDLKFENEWLFTDNSTHVPSDKNENYFLISTDSSCPRNSVTHSGKLTFDMINMTGDVQGEEIFITKRSQESMNLVDVHKFKSKCVCFKTDEKLKQIHVCSQASITPGLDSSSYFH